MNNVFKLIDRIPLLPLAMIAFFLAIVPLNSTPHLFEKLGMLFQWTLTRPIDIFDLLMHGTPVLLLVIRVVRIGLKRLQASQ